MTTPKKIEVAVIGGGIGGLCVAIGLLKHKHLNVNIYKTAHKFAEIEASIAIGANSQRAMAAIDPKIHAAFLSQATNNGWESERQTWFQFRDGTEGHDEALLTAPTNQTGQTTVHRALFLDELVKLVPKEIAHFGKRVDQIVDNGENGITLHFKDNTTVTADAVIGADGVHSPTRAFLLGADHPATKPQFTHTVAYRGLIPMDEAREAIGSEFSENSMIWTSKDNISNVCMMGDGAHASTPYQGQGAGQATEDALVLESLLGRITDKKQIAAAFKAYDQVRRPRTQKVVATSREAGELLSQTIPSIGGDLQKIKQQVETRMFWMWDKDMNEQVQEAVKAMEGFLALT
jgi:2-polyprenyl-6-methoxyphenol hydroxylase-like FAD-dependent oxidoreductase